MAKVQNDPLRGMWTGNTVHVVQKQKLNASERSRLATAKEFGYLTCDEFKERDANLLNYYWQHCTETLFPCALIGPRRSKSYVRIDLLPAKMQMTEAGREQVEAVINEQLGAGWRKDQEGCALTDDQVVLENVPRLNAIRLVLELMWVFRRDGPCDGPVDEKLRLPFEKPERVSMRDATVQLIEDGNSMGVMTDALTPEDFLGQCAFMLADMVTTDGAGGDWLKRFTAWLPQITEVACKLKGYKAEVREQRLLIAGEFNPDAFRKVKESGPGMSVRMADDRRNGNSLEQILDKNGAAV